MKRGFFSLCLVALCSIQGIASRVDVSKVIDVASSKSKKSEEVEENHATDNDDLVQGPSETPTMPPTMIELSEAQEHDHSSGDAAEYGEGGEGSSMKPSMLARALGLSGGAAEAEKGPPKKKQIWRDMEKNHQPEDVLAELLQVPNFKVRAVIQYDGSPIINGQNYGQAPWGGYGDRNGRVGERDYIFSNDNPPKVLEYRLNPHCGKRAMFDEYRTPCTPQHPLQRQVTPPMFVSKHPIFRQLGETGIDAAFEIYFNANERLANGTTPPQKLFHLVHSGEQWRAIAFPAFYGNANLDLAGQDFGALQAPFNQGHIDASFTVIYGRRGGWSPAFRSRHMKTMDYLIKDDEVLQFSRFDTRGNPQIKHKLWEFFSPDLYKIMNRIGAVVFTYHRQFFYLFSYPDDAAPQQVVLWDWKEKQILGQWQMRQS